MMLAIGHNGKTSATVACLKLWSRSRGNRWTTNTRQRPPAGSDMYEVTQIKGDGETHPLLSPNDEFADYETWDKGNLDLSVLKTDDMLEYEYARSALKLGLRLESQIGA